MELLKLREISGQNRERLYRGICMLGSVLIFFLVVLYKLDYSSLWGDEAVEYWFSKVASGPIHGVSYDANMYERINFTYQPPFYNMFMHIWLMFGHSEWWMRFFSVICGTIGVVGIFKAVEKVANYWVAAVMVIFTAFNKLYFYYCQEAAEYCLLLCFSCWSVYFFVSYLIDSKKVYEKEGAFLGSYESTRKRNLILMMLFGVFALYSQYGGAFPLLAMCLCCFLFYIHNRREIFRQLLWYIGSFVFTVIPLVWFFMLIQIRHQQHSNMVSHMVFNGNPIFDFVYDFLIVFKTSLMYNVPDIYILLLLGLCVLAILVVLIRGSRQGRCIVVSNLFIWIFYYIVVKCGLYANGGFGYRYELCFTPLWTVCFTALFVEAFRLVRDKFLSLEKVGESDKKRIVTAASLIMVFLVLGTAIPSWRIISQGVTKSRIRELTACWLEQDFEAAVTIVDRPLYAGFAYYLRLRDDFVPAMEENVLYATIDIGILGLGQHDYSGYYDARLGQKKPQTIYLMACDGYNGWNETLLEKGYEQVETVLTYGEQEALLRYELVE